MQPLFHIYGSKLEENEARFTVSAAIFAAMITRG